MISALLLAIESDDDRDFMEQIFLSYRWLMYSESYKIVRNKEAAEDVLQTVLIKLISKLERLRTFEREHLVAYIIKTVQTTSYKHLDKETRNSGYSLIEDLDSLEDAAGGLDVQILRFEANETLKAAWQSLDNRSRLLLEMKYFQKYSDEEIAKEIGVSPASLRGLLSRARKKLKTQMFDL